MVTFMLDMAPLEIRLFLELFWVGRGEKIPITISGPLEGCQGFLEEKGLVRREEGIFEGSFEAKLEYGDFLHDPRVFEGVLHYKGRKTACVITLMHQSLVEAENTEVKEGTVV